MRVLFASPFPYLPHNTSGREVTTHAMALRLRDRGSAAAVFAGLPPGPTAADAPYVTDEGLGYPVFRASRPLAAYHAVLAAWHPDAVVLPLSAPCAPLAAIDLQAGIRTAFLATNADTQDLATQLIAQPGIGLIANSPFTARRLETLFGVRPPILLPLIEPEPYRVASQGDAVLMVNPSVEKGVETFFRLAAARPAIPFLAVESWTVTDTWRTVLMNRARTLGNVELWPAVEDMREALARARIVLMPSIYEETYGRAVAEAQLSGIPALVSDRGALPETLGAGGRVAPLDGGIGPWLEALDSLWNDPAQYRACAAAALAEAARPERQPERIVADLLGMIEALSPPISETGGSPRSATF